MNCVEAKSCLDPRLDGELEPARASLFDEHLAVCALCRSEFGEAENLRAALRRVAPRQPSARLDGRVMEAYRRRHDASAARASIPSWQAFLVRRVSVPAPALALGLVLFALALLAAVNGRRPASEVESPIEREPRIVEVPVEVPVERERVVRVPVIVYRAAVQPERKEKPARSAVASEERRPALQSYKNSSAGEISYSTSAALEGFEPLPKPAARVLKGAEKW